MIGPYEAPLLTEEAVLARVKEDRIQRIQKALEYAATNSGYDLFTWVGLSVQRERRVYAEAVEPLLAAAEGKVK